MWLVLPVRRLLRKLVLPLTVLSLLPLVAPVPADKLQQGPPSPVQLRLVPVLARPLLAPVVCQLGHTGSFHVLVWVVLVPVWA